MHIAMRICPKCRLIASDDPVCPECGWNIATGGVTGPASDLARRYAEHLQYMAVFIAVIAYLTKFLPAFSMEAAAGVLFAVLIARLITLNSQSSQLAAAARQDPRFLAYNAGFAWGSWLMLLALVLVFLGLLVGGLRQLDLKRGLPE